MTSLQSRDFLQSFQEDFTQWTEDHFKQVNRAFRRELIAVLSSKGVHSYDQPDITQSIKLHNMVKGECTVQDNATRGLGKYPTLPTLSPQMPDRTKLSSPLPQIPYEEPKRKEPTPREPVLREGPSHPSPNFAQTLHEPYSRSPAPHAELLRRTDNVPSYYWQDQPAQPVHNDSY
jgi:hypothetical protein